MSMRIGALAVLAAALLPWAGLFAGPSPRTPAKGLASRFQALHGERAAKSRVAVEGDPSVLESQGFDVARHGSERPGEPVDVVADAEDLERLAELGYAVRPRPEAGAFARDDWPTLAEVEARTDALVAANPDIMHKFRLGTSIEGRALWAVRVSTAPAEFDPAKPKVSINGNHHAREVMTVAAAMDVLDVLAAEYRAGDPAAVRWVQGLEVYVTPVVNPDGYHHVMSDDEWWRKNRRPNHDGSVGVDLNRNYLYAWGANEQGSSSWPDDETYRGTAAGSEPEVAAMIGLARSIRPLFNLSYHSYAEVLLYPYGYENAKNPEGDTMEQLSTEVMLRMTRDTGSGTFTKRSRLYPVNGLDRDWYYFELGTYSFVPEISSPSRGFHPGTEWIAPTVTGLRAAWMYLLDRALGIGLRGQVLDTEGLPVPGARVEVATVKWKNGEPQTASDLGWFHKLVGAGAVTLKVSAPGYVSRELPVVVGDASLTRIEVRLERAPPPVP